MDHLPTHTVQLVEASYLRVANRARALAIAFDEEIVETAPSLHRVFPRDDVSHRRTELAFVAFVVENLLSERLVVLLEHLGARGMLCGLGTDEITTIERVLLAVLRRFDAELDDDTRQAWATAFEWTVTALRRGSETAQNPRPVSHRPSVFNR